MSSHHVLQTPEHPVESTNSRKAFVWGASGHAKVVANILRAAEGAEIVGFIDEVQLNRKGEPFFGATVAGGAEMVPFLAAQGVKRAFVGVGNNERRMIIGEELEADGFIVKAAVHPAAVVAADVVLGWGALVSAGAVINSGARLGKHVIVNTNATVEHDCVVGTGTHIGPGAQVAGHVEIGEAAWIGIGAVISDRVRIGQRTIVGAGAVVIRDVPDFAVVVGVPAKVMRFVEH